MRAEQQTQCCKPLQKMMVKLGPCKINLSSPVFILLVVPRRYFCCESICLCFGVDFLCCLKLMHVFIVQKPNCQYSFLPPRCLEWEFLSDCPFSVSVLTCTFLKITNVLLETVFFLEWESLSDCAFS